MKLTFGTAGIMKLFDIETGSDKLKSLLSYWNLDDPMSNRSDETDSILMTATLKTNQLQMLWSIQL